jgi:hypothetical protein
MRIMAGVGDLGQRTEDCEVQVRYSVTGRSRGQMTLCVVCTVHKETTSWWFLGSATNPSSTVSPSMATKLAASGFFQFVPQNW